MLSRSRGPRLVLVVYLVLLHLDVIHAWTIPESIRVDSNGTPRLADLLGRTVGCTTRGLLLIRSMDECKVQVRASSNRNVLRGEIDSVQLYARNLRGPLLHLKEFQLHASSVSLGRWPWGLLLLPVVVWKLRRALLWILLIGWIYPKFGNNIRTKLQPLRERLKGNPWSLDYKIVIAQKDIQTSRLVQLALKAVLRSLMLNSVLATVAAAGDAITLSQNDAYEQNQQQQPRNLSTNLRLGPSKNAVSKLQEQSFVDKRNPSKREPMLTKLLEATDFDLTNTTFGKQGRILLDADAILEDTKFSYTLRVTPQPMVFDGQNMLVFTNPECRFRTGVMVGGPFEKFLPDLWLPVGPGVGLPLGTNHWIRNIDTKEGDTCAIMGRISFFRKEKPRGFGALVGDSFPRPLPFSTRSDRALPPSRQ